MIFSLTKKQPPFAKEGKDSFVLIFGAVYLLSQPGQLLTSGTEISEYRVHVLQRMQNQDFGCVTQWFGPTMTMDLAQTLGLIRAAWTETKSRMLSTT